MEYPKTTNIKRWEEFLNRKLQKNEIKLLYRTSNEIQLNKLIYNLVDNIKNKNLYIPTLTASDGNCLFESICYKLKNIQKEILRNEIAVFMRMYKSYPSLFPNQELSLNDMFMCYNEIDYIYDKNTNKLYKYTYDIMCSDLSCDNSWERLPVEIILMCASFIYDIKFIIYHNNGYTHEINTSENINDIVYLGLLGEFHYIPLDIKINIDNRDDNTDNNSDNRDNNSDDNTNYIKIYNNYMDKFNIWIRERINEKLMLNNINSNNYLNNNNNNNNSNINDNNKYL